MDNQSSKMTKQELVKKLFSQHRIDFTEAEILLDDGFADYLFKERTITQPRYDNETLVNQLAPPQWMIDWHSTGYTPNNQHLT
jgi:hypothetical protein